jgi:7-keto-8-aminopelargonate synthetase-like enzyme
VNSCGSPLAFGGHKFYYQLIDELQEFWGVSNIMLLSAGWLAGFGAIKVKNIKLLTRQKIMNYLFFSIPLGFSKS